MTARKRLKENAANRREGAEHISIGYVPEISISVYFLARWSFYFFFPFKCRKFSISYESTLCRYPNHKHRFCYLNDCRVKIFWILRKRNILIKRVTKILTKLCYFMYTPKFMTRNDLLSIRLMNITYTFQTYMHMFLVLIRVWLPLSIFLP